MFRFKTPSQKTLEIMSDVAKGDTSENFENKCIEKIKRLTSHEFVEMTSSGNNSIFVGINKQKQHFCRFIPSHFIKKQHFFKKIQKIHEEKDDYYEVLHRTNKKIPEN